jgi:hypothetical protein
VRPADSCENPHHELLHELCKVWDIATLLSPTAFNVECGMFLEGWLEFRRREIGECVGG